MSTMAREEGGDNDDSDLAKLESLEAELQNRTPQKRGRPKTKEAAKARAKANKWSLCVFPFG